MKQPSINVAVISRDLFTRRVVVPMACAILGAIFMVVGFVIFTAQGQNRLEVDSSTKLAETALSVSKRQIARHLKDYTVWEDAYKNLHEEINLDWASRDGNVGANIHQGLGYELAFVVNSRRETVYSVIEGVPQEANAFEIVPRGLQDLITAGLTSPTPAVGVLRSSQGLILVAAQAILPPSVVPETLPPDQRSALVFAKRLDGGFLSRMSSEYLLQNLRIVFGSEPSHGANIPLLGTDGETLGYLVWTPDRPGYELLRLLLPPLVMSIVVLAAFAWLVVSNARRTTTALEESAKTVEAYAQTLEESESRFRDVAEASSDWIWECDPQLRLIYLSTRFSEMTGIAAASLLGKTLESCFAPAEGVSIDRQLVSKLRKRVTFRDIRCRYQDARQRDRKCRLAGRPIFDANGIFIGFRGTATDITEEVEAQARAQHLALHDSLTALPNRVLFSERLNVALADRRKNSTRLAVLCLDLDNFKEVNDTLGHAAGDLLLKSVAERLKCCARPTDTVARLGGDEFAIIQTDIRSAADARSLSGRIIEIVKEPFHLEGHLIHVGVSIGVAMSYERGSSPEKLLKNADIALYRAKKGGRNMVRFFEVEMDLELQERKALEYDLRHAIARRELDIYYQPIIDVRNEKIVGVEALLRWDHPERGWVEPEVFIPIAEDTGLISAIGEWVIRVASEHAARWPDIRIAINMSAVQFRQRDIVETVAQILKNVGLPPGRLELEITESVLINDEVLALDVLQAFRDLGIRVALDDFGTGFSSLACLNAFPFDKIKIDRSFIASSQHDNKALAIVKSVISLGHSLGIATTAEGVETTDQVKFLVAEGCDQVQGHLFGLPMSADETTDFLSGWTSISKNGGSFAAA